MSSILLDAPAGEPVSLAEAKLFLRVEHDDDDDIIAALIAGARIHVEAQTRRALITQTWRLVRDVWPATGCMRGPAGAAARARLRRGVHDSDGTTLALDVATISRRHSSGAGACWRSRVARRPRPGGTVGGIEIDIEVGYGDASRDVPEPLRQAIRLLVAHWYENRGMIAAGGEVAVLPESGRGADRARTGCCRYERLPAI